MIADDDHEDKNHNDANVVPVVDEWLFNPSFATSVRAKWDSTLTTKWDSTRHKIVPLALLNQKYKNKKGEWTMENGRVVYRVVRGWR